MKARFPYRRAADPSPPAQQPDVGPGPLVLVDRSCCCLAPPVVVAIMPPTAQRPHPVDILLCGHHYRICRDALAAAGATVYGDTGLFATTTADQREAAGPEPADAAPRK